MNDFKKIVAIVVAVLCGLYSILSTAGWIKFSVYSRRVERELEQCRTELGDVRNQLIQADNRQRDIDQGLDNIEERLLNSKELLSVSVTTVAGLREQIRVLRKNYEDMEMELYMLRNNYSSNDNDGHSTNGK